MTILNICLEEIICHVSGVCKCSVSVYYLPTCNWAFFHLFNSLLSIFGLLFCNLSHNNASDTHQSNLPTIPDYPVFEHTEHTCILLVSDTTSHEQATVLLTNLWATGNQAEKLLWQTQVDTDELEAEAVCQQEDEAHTLGEAKVLEDKANLHKEEHQKHQAKFLPNHPASTEGPCHHCPVCHSTDGYGQLCSPMVLHQKRTWKHSCDLQLRSQWCPNPAPLSWWLHFINPSILHQGKEHHQRLWHWMGGFLHHDTLDNWNYEWGQLM